MRSSLYISALFAFTTALDDVGFLFGTGIGSSLINPFNLTSFKTIAAPSLRWAHNVDYHLARNFVFFSMSYGIYRSTLEPNMIGMVNETTKVANVTFCGGFAVDWVHDCIYWADCIKNTIMVMDLDGGNVTTVFKRPGDATSVRRMEIDPLQGKLFWTANGVIESCGLLGDNFLTEMSGPDVVDVSALALDLTAQRLYYDGTFNGSRSLYVMDYEGNYSQHHLRFPKMKGVYGLGIFRNYVYWFNHNFDEGMIFKSPLQGNSSAEFLRTKLEWGIYHMRVVHPDLQKPSRSDPCKEMQCSHYCVPQSEITAECRCPDDHKLDSDRVSCSKLIEFRPVGCYEAQYSLEQGSYVYMPNMTLNKCLNYASAHGKTFAALLLSENLCFIGDDIAARSVVRNDSECHTPCPDYQDQKCGGNWLISLYDISENLPFGDEVRFLMVGTGVRMVWKDLKDHDITVVANFTSRELDYHFHKNLVFYNDPGAIYRSLLTPGNNDLDNSPKLVMKSPNPDGFAVDWVADRIFWVDVYNRTISTMDLEGNNLTTILTLPHIDPFVTKYSRTLVEVDPYEGKLFWTADDRIESCGLTGEDLRTNMSGPGVIVLVIALDLPNRKLFYFGNINFTTILFSMDYNGENIHEHWSMPKVNFISGLGIFRNYVYWESRNAYSSVLYKAPLNLTEPHDVQRITATKEDVWYMKIVHRDLQKKPKGDPCVDKGCSQSCEAKTPSSVTCQCPANYTLDANGLTCSRTHTKEN